MPEIKHNFTAGKMNKDLDERLIPNGEYRDAMNIQVSTSEGADVGTIQNILGNSKVPEQEFLENLAITCVGSIADEKNDKLYWMLAGSNEFNIGALLDSDPLDRVRVDIKDMILEYNNTTNEVTPVIIDIYNISIPQSTGFSASPNPNQPFILNTLINPSGIDKGMTLVGYNAQGTEEFKATVIDIFGTNVVLSEDIPDFFAIEWFVFTKDRVLFFNPSNTITGINIIDDFLIWTDNCYEPRKINIQRSIDGTQYTTTNTRLIAPKNNTTLASNILLKESHITVIRKSPKLPPIIEYDTGRDDNLVYTAKFNIGSPVDNLITSSQGTLSDFSNLSAGDWFIVHIEEDIDNNQNPNLTWNVNDKVVLKEFDSSGDPPTIPIKDYRIKGVVTEVWDNAYLTAVFTTQAPALLPIIGSWYKIEISSISGFPPVPDTSNNQHSLQYAIDVFDETEKLFEFKFPRFAYRYRYEDGEYSTFSPFTEVAFEPGSFDYHLTKGYNLAMTNNLVSLKIKNFVTDDMPEDVVAIDLLYKEEVSPNVYIVDTIKPTSVDNYWLDNEYGVKSDTIKNATLPSNQLLRLWDNVPIKALSQEIVGNRIVYGNYEQNYNLHTDNHDDYSPIFEHSLSTTISTPSDPLRSIKSLREYQLGVVFVDEYGRETPVMSDTTGTFKADKSYSNTANKLNVKMVGTEFPKEMKYFKFFIKETAGEYYNMAMGRWYDAKDDNIWLTFPSTDRNKIDLDSVLILKKGPNSDDVIGEAARYKVLAIENEAPDYIKTSQYLVEEQDNIEDTSTLGSGVLFGDTLSSGVQPASNGSKFQMKFGPFDNSTGNALDEITDDLYVEFTIKNSNNVSDRYKVNKITKNGPTHASSTTGTNLPTDYTITIDGNFGDIDFITNTGTSTGSRIAFDAQVRIYKYVVENKPEFDGRFFVKIYNDTYFKEKVIANAVKEVDHSVIASRKVYLMNSEYNDLSSGSTPQNASDWRNVAQTLANSDSVNWGNNKDFKPQHFYFFNSSNGPWANNFLNKYNDYWFIDKSGHQGIFKNDKLDANWSNLGSSNGNKIEPCTDNDGYGGDPDHGINNSPIKVNKNPHHNQDYGAGILSTPNESEMELSFGPIRSGWDRSVKETGEKRTGVIWEYTKFTPLGKSQFFNITQRVGATKTSQRNFAQEIVPSTLIRWKNDPNYNTYRINKSVKYKQKARHTIDHRNCIAQDSLESVITMNLFPDLIFTGGYGCWWDNVDDWDTNRKSPYVLPDNWIKSYVTTIEPKLEWDPVNDAGDGSILDGEKIVLTAETTTDGINAISSSGSVPYEYSIDIHTITAAVGNIGEGKDIYVGMALQSFTNTSGATVPLSEVLVVEKIVGTRIYFSGWSNSITSSDTLTNPGDKDHSAVYTFVQPAMNGFTETSARAWNEANQSTTVGLVAFVGYELEIVKPTAAEAILPDDPAIFETEPKDITELDLYYEISGYNPIELKDDDIQSVLPIGSTVQHVSSSGGGSALPTSTKIIGFNSPHEIILDTSFAGTQVTLITPAPQVGNGDEFIITRPDGVSISVTIDGLGAGVNQVHNSVLINPILYNSTYTPNWHNCYSFGNGVESNRIRDNFNLQYILNGVKVSAVLEEGEYEREHRKYGLIYSGLYNSISGVNNLNQFIQAEKITKDINPIYGSIQKLHTRNDDLVTLCEDKILRILANKDAVYEADGNTQLTATNFVLGQTIPFSGEYGISKNPESFASENYRVYFSDKVRGAVMRLSKDGLTPISNHGMKDWFRDNLKLSDKIIGSYDDRNDEYNITLDYPVQKTVSFKEDVRGWISFKSFVPENAVSCANNYFTIFQGILYKHYNENVDRNTFYDNYINSSVNVILNESPGSIKSFHTLDYEGSQSQITPMIHYTTDQGDILQNEYYNLTAKDGWYVSNFVTDQENGSLDEFIEKEGKWFNYLHGKSITTSGGLSAHVKDNYDTSSFAVQGIGFADSIECPNCNPCIYGCMDPTQQNYNPLATCDDINNPCGPPHIYGCMDDGTDSNYPGRPTNYSGPALNYYSSVTIDDGSCTYTNVPLARTGPPSGNGTRTTSTPISWDCVDFNCVDPGNGSGQYSSLAACQAGCISSITYDCGNPAIGQVAGLCYANNSGTGQYPTWIDCYNSCAVSVATLPTWDCVDGDCVDPGTGQGAYDSILACEAACHVVETDSNDTNSDY